MIPVEDGTKGDAQTPTQHATIDTSARNVGTTITQHQSAQKCEFDRWFLRPKYVRDFVWTEQDLDPRPTLAFVSLHLPPVPTPPANELTNSTALRTIQNHSSLFSIVTPINVDRFEQLLSTHPNKPFILSICRALREGFWPWADTSNPDLPTTWDNSFRPIKEQRHREFVRDQCLNEVQIGQFSPSFGRDLLPGMYSMPIGVVPKPHSDRFRLVVDQSAEPHSQNSMIPKSEASIWLDSMHDLGHILRSVRASHPDQRLVMWKSDVTHAYCLMPMHPLWQIRQVMTINGLHHVNRCNHFGNRAAGRVWGSFFALVLWIAICLINIEDLLAYVDDTFSWDFEDCLDWYDPYHKCLPSKQVRLLLLWDDLGIPHEDAKQVFGSPLTIIGFDVDPNAMTITMPLRACTDLVQTIHAFAKHGQRCSLHDFQSLAGWLNWALNAYPLLRPALSTLYHKISGKSSAHQLIWVSTSLCRELLWFVDHVVVSDGVHFLKSVEWNPESANFVFFTDACPLGLAFWSPNLLQGFQCANDPNPHNIFFLEAYAVLSAVHHVVHNIFPLPRCLLVYTDSSNTVDLFNTLHASPDYNPILITTVDLLLSSDISLRVLHVPGHDNVIADALSCFENARAFSAAPTLSITTFLPPQLSLGAPTK